MPFHGSSNNLSMDEMSDEDGISLATDEGESSSFGDDELAELENRAVSCLRTTVFTVLALAALLISLLVHQSSTRAETLHFQEAYHDASLQVLETVQASLQRALGALHTLAVDCELFAVEATTSQHHAQWPLVTLPGFDRRAQSIRDMAIADLIIVLPVVTNATQTAWEQYAVQHQGWLHPSLDSVTSESASWGETDSNSVVATQRWLKNGEISPFVFNESGRCAGSGQYAPLWQAAPLVPTLSQWVNFDMLSAGSMKRGIEALQQRRAAVLGEVILPLDGNSSSSIPAKFWNDTGISGPASPIFYPVRRRSAVVAVLSAVSPWERYLSKILSARIFGLRAVLQTDCGSSWTFEINGDAAHLLGKGDWHESKFNHMSQSSTLLNFTNSTASSSIQSCNESCPYTLVMYPSSAMRSSFVTWTPFWNTLVAMLIFALAGVAFVLYDTLVERRQKIVMDRALQSTAIVSSLFPETVRDRLFRRGSLSERGADDGSLTVDETPASNPSDVMSPLMVVQPAKMRLKSFLTDLDDGMAGAASKPIADLFPRCTVLFADISGFTAWSSLRDPAQVFMLLESVYQSFDRIARKRGVFKVETIGDSYVAVTGLPEPQEDHAVIMARFARDCKYKMNDVTRKLEVTLGPDTGDLRMRFGLHSGPVTAGVLRGEKSRFQLFGDTVNTAARMESTGMRDKIQLSQATADALIEAGKAHWLVKRDTKVVAKGKGEMQTYWLDDSFRTRRQSTGENSRCSVSSVDSGRTFDTSSNHLTMDKSVIWGADEEIPEVVSQRTKHQRLIDYNVDLLACRLKHVVARRKVLEMAGRRCSQGGLPANMDSYRDESKIENGNVLEEVTEVIKLPSFNSKAYKGNVDPDSIELSAEVMSQLRRYVTIIAAMYRNNPFHNFEHASHVTMSVNKLLQRVVAPEITFKRRSLQMDGNSIKKQIASDLHNYTYGITSDPLTHFAVVFSALIHDCDHWGVSNDQLVKEGVAIAEKYNGKSIAEQNSVDLAWDLLMDDEEYGALQQCIFPTDAELKRFRQVVVNVVMATDIFDRELCEMRNNRWAKVFAEREPGAPPDLDDENRKATIVIEHIMQASDVAHTMQHWHVYQKWNRRLFDELYTAFRANRMDRDPSDFWYRSELKFFDGYIIPLAKKLKECGVFGVSSDECLNYATDNRREWESKGQMIVSELVSNYQQREREEAEALAAAQSNAAASSAKKKRGRMSRRRSLMTTGG